MRVAAIDVGTNSVRLLAAEAQPPSFRAVDRRLTITRLGEGVDRKKALSAEALTRTLGCIAEYAAVCGELGVGHIRVAGTSAVRDARNRDELFDGVQRLTGTELEVLAGNEEARLTFLGALSDLAPEGSVLLVDIGGGSTELVYGALEPEGAISLNIGCVRLFERHLHSDPPSPRELEELREDAREQLAGARGVLDISKADRLVGVAGTVTQLAALKAGTLVYDPDVTHHSVLSHGDVRRLARRLASLPVELRKQLPSLVPGRADVIVAGAEILLAVMDTFDAPEVLVSERDILDGLVLDLLERDAGTNFSNSL
jgi:exopolyphosphatase/guanosine-5'-triphosphate,3'-diphosphate pyrophosphatase